MLEHIANDFWHVLTHVSSMFLPFSSMFLHFCRVFAAWLFFGASWCIAHCMRTHRMAQAKGLASMLRTRGFNVLYDEAVSTSRARRVRRAREPEDRVPQALHVVVACCKTCKTCGTR